MSFSVVMIGAGNVAWHLTKRLVVTGFNIVQVYSRTEKSARELAQLLKTNWTNRLEEIDRNADMYFIALKDDAVTGFLKNAGLTGKILVHCSGSLSIDIFADYTAKSGVFYPLQTFSKARSINFREIPVFIEGSTDDLTSMLFEIGAKVAGNVQYANSHQRLILHIAAVFSGNFVNHLYSIAAGILEENQLSYEVLYPLMKETLHKAFELHPFISQTGPAVRNDKGITGRHKKELENNHELLKIYTILSEHIYTLHKK